MIHTNQYEINVVWHPLHIYYDTIHIFFHDNYNKEKNCLMFEELIINCTAHEIGKKNLWNSDILKTSSTYFLLLFHRFDLSSKLHQVLSEQFMNEVS